MADPIAEQLEALHARIQLDPADLEAHADRAALLRRAGSGHLIEAEVESCLSRLHAAGRDDDAHSLSVWWITVRARASRRGTEDTTIVELDTAMRHRSGRAHATPRPIAGLTRASAHEHLDQSDLPPGPILDALEVEVRSALLEAMFAVAYPKGTVIVPPGASAERLFFIHFGRVRVSRMDELGDHHLIATLGRGDHFGEFELLGGEPSRAQVVAHEDTQPLELSHVAAQLLIDADESLRRTLWAEYERRLARVVALTTLVFLELPAETREEVVDGFERLELDAGDVLIPAGDPNERLWIVTRGGLRYGAPDQPLAEEMRAGDFFGFASALSGEALHYDLVATADTSLLVLPAARTATVIQHVVPFAAAASFFQTLSLKA